MEQFLVLIVATLLGVQNSESLPYSTSYSNPSYFLYKTGRYPGDVDRFHEESNDGTGLIRGNSPGSYTYVHPQHQGRPFDHPTSVNYNDFVSRPSYPEAARFAKETHNRHYQRIGNGNNYGRYTQEKDITAIAAENHIRLYNQIAQQHLAIGAQRAGLYK